MILGSLGPLTKFSLTFIQNLFLWIPPNIFQRVHIQDHCLFHIKIFQYFPESSKVFRFLFYLIIFSLINHFSHCFFPPPTSILNSSLESVQNYVTQRRKYLKFSKFPCMQKENATAKIILRIK